MDPAILACVCKQDQDDIQTASEYGFSSFTETSKLHCPSTKHDYFLKTSPKSKESQIMFQGEYESLNLLRSVIPEAVPKVFGWGKLNDSNTQAGFFLLSEYLPIKHTLIPSTRLENNLAHIIVKLHNKNVGEMYGLSNNMVTCCGSTPQPNPATKLWSEFFILHRLKYIIDLNRSKGYIPSDMDQIIEKILNFVAPTLLENLEREEPNLRPSLVHGDLWSGNVAYASKSTFGNFQNEPLDEDKNKEKPDKSNNTISDQLDIHPVIYDPACTFAHSEYEFGIMHMFGGFSKKHFFHEYHRLRPKHKPESEYLDRIRLYSLYHQLNHSYLFGGGGYLTQAKSTMVSLINKFAK